MHLKNVFFAAIFALFAQNNTSAPIPNRQPTQQRCETICNKSGAKAAFDAEANICKCSFTKNVDDTDISLIQKNAKIAGIELKTIQPLKNASVIIKREIHHDRISKHDGGDTKNATPELQEQSSLSPAAIVGQRAPSASGTSSRNLHQRLVAQRNREGRPITAEQQRLIIQQMRDHLNRLSQARDQRARQFEIEGLKTNIRQLSDTSIIIINPQLPQQRTITPPPRTTPQLPQQRSRLRNAVEDIRKRQGQRLGPQNNRLGATHEEDKNGNRDETDTVKAEAPTSPHIITQPPNLIED